VVGQYLVHSRVKPQQTAKRHAHPARHTDYSGGLVGQKVPQNLLSSFTKIKVNIDKTHS
jgi:hypothetical protein